MVKLKRFIFNSFQVNTYLVYDNSGACVIIDPACDSQEEEVLLSSFMDQHKLTPIMQVCTHCHIDHILGLHFIKKKFKIPTLIHTEESSILKNGHLMGEVFGFHRETFPPADRILSHGESISFGNSMIKALHVPGHSPGSLAFYSEEGNFALTGDALFSGSIGRTDLPGGDYDILIGAIRTHLFTLPPETTIHPGHGEPSTIAREIAENPFFG
jgi:glyoxylase-like metal-dependent hydrolase (beta-lactamase superfamily II)